MRGGAHAGVTGGIDWLPEFVGIWCESMAEIIKAAPAKAPGLQFPEQKLVKKDSFAAMNEAASILDAARLQAKHILENAEEQAKQAIAQAHQDGEARGLERYLTAITEAQTSVESFYSKAEPELVRLAAAIKAKRRRCPVRAFLVHAPGRGAVATHALVPGVQALPWTELVENL